MKSLQRFRRRGSMYALVIGVATMVAIIGLSGLTLARIQARMTTRVNDWDEAGGLAQSAVEWALSLLASQPEWRTMYISGTETTPTNLGRGTMSFKLVDESDGDLADHPGETVRLYGIGCVRQATRVCSLLLAPAGDEPLDVLRTTLHAERVLRPNSGTTVVTVGGPISSNVLIWNYGTVQGDAEAPAFAGVGGIITGSQIITPAKIMPLANIFDELAAVATTIPYAGLPGGQILGHVLSATANPTGGPTNTNGIYYVSVPTGSRFVIKCSRIKGTLVVNAASATTVEMQQPMLWEPHSTQYPILVVQGTGVNVTLACPPTDLVESSLNQNLNPPGTPYNGHEDLLKDDTYPSELHGLIHVINDSKSTTYVMNNVRIIGNVIVHGMMEVQNATVTHDSNLFAHPPHGYAGGWQVAPSPGSWRWEILP